ncbi:hypothetical protein DICVIV_00178 [Dictyocaulus viviparus]|uniref:Uncharacterized protein n=1 Tax=Dictyocaulus viviparus TaxID=29172 RepID=A0A0D8YCI7_DICVI|nr:hypothetical protein DICVIV_00178 [Dictyocaulus viviparus]
MERESRHSKEEEEELDRKIAQIREKNQKIVERKKEIDAELAIYSDEYQKKSPKPSPISSNKTTKTSKGQWDREWDKGKTPAETWRENVPSMEIRRKPARGGGGGVGLQRGQRGGSKFRTTSSRSGSDNAAPLQACCIYFVISVAKGSRLDGRVSVLPAETNTARRGRGRGGARPNYKRRVFTNSNGDVKVNVKLQENELQNQSSQPAQQKNPRKTAKTSPNKGESPKKSSSTLKQRRSTDKYEIRKLLRKLVNKVDQLERRERQKQQSKNSKASKSITPQTTPKTKESSNSVTNSVTSTESSDSKATKHSEADVVSKTIKPSESSKSGADANQNIIKLVEEKVLQIQMS